VFPPLFGPDAAGEFRRVKGCYAVDAEERHHVFPVKTLHGANEQGGTVKGTGFIKTAFENGEHVFGADVVIPVEGLHQFKFFFAG
jgi:hypothetical protein